MSGYVEKGTFFKRNPEWYYYDENDYLHLTEKAPPEEKKPTLGFPGIYHA